MRIQFLISKTANFFFFVSNLAEWHHSCRKEYNKQWIIQTGEITEIESNAIKSISPLLKKYGFRKDRAYIGNLFFTPRNSSPHKLIRKIIHEKDRMILSRAMKILRPRFNLIWEKELKHNRLEVIKKILTTPRYENYLHDIQFFFGDNKSPKINVVVLLSPLDNNETAAGGANLCSPYITFEISRLENNSWQTEYSIHVLGHEIAHMLFHTSGKEKLIEKALQISGMPKEIPCLQMNSFSLVNELMVGSFFPRGAYAQQFSNFRLAHTLLSNIQRGFTQMQELGEDKIITFHPHVSAYLISKLYPLTSTYIYEKRPVDLNYILAICKTIKSEFMI